jgi:hypothetical protein
LQIRDFSRRGLVGFGLLAAERGVLAEEMIDPVLGPAELPYPAAQDLAAIGRYLVVAARGPRFLGRPGREDRALILERAEHFVDDAGLIGGAAEGVRREAADEVVSVRGFSDQLEEEERLDVPPDGSRGVAATWLCLLGQSRFSLGAIST